MSSLEVTKILGAVLTAGIVAMLAGFISHLVVHPEMPAERAYPVEGAVAEQAPAAGAPAAEAPAAEAPAAEEPERPSALPLLASADAAAGKKIARKCTSCHTVDKGGANRIGPNLWNVVGRTIASAEGFNYSDAMTAKSGERWTYENLDHFLGKPRDWVPGTRMSFAGLNKAEERADLIAYLRSLSDSPAPLPE